MRLIKKDESDKLFDMQECIISNSLLGKIEKRCKLAILNTFEPICDYYTAYDILDEQRHEMDYASNLIGAYLGAVWIFDKHNDMLEILCKSSNQFDEKKQAEIKYLEALQKFHRDGNYIEDIRKSIELCDRISAPYLMLLESGNYNLMKKEELIEKIRNNSVIRETEQSELLEPDIFIQHYICRSVICKTQFDNIPM